MEFAWLVVFAAIVAAALALYGFRSAPETAGRRGHRQGAARGESARRPVAQAAPHREFADETVPAVLSHVPQWDDR